MPAFLFGTQLRDMVVWHSEAMPGFDMNRADKFFMQRIQVSCYLSPGSVLLLRVLDRRRFQTVAPVDSRNQNSVECRGHAQL
jgi:hypothetical protein